MHFRQKKKDPHIVHYSLIALNMVNSYENYIDDEGCLERTYFICETVDLEGDFLSLRTEKSGNFIYLMFLRSSNY